MPLRFFIEQVAICPANPAKAKELLEAIAGVEWAEDHVTAEGKVYGSPARNEANLSFTYTLIQGKEFEVLEYTAGEDWIGAGHKYNSVSHFGMHCSPEELQLWRAFFAERNIGVAQEVRTVSHTNPVIAGKRTYEYVIFNTRQILGVDLKFIVRYFTEQP